MRCGNDGERREEEKLKGGEAEIEGRRDKERKERSRE